MALGKKLGVNNFINVINIPEKNDYGQQVFPIIIVSIYGRTEKFSILSNAGKRKIEITHTANP